MGGEQMRLAGYTEEQLDRAAKAVYEVTGGAIGYGKRRRGRYRTTVDARLVASEALDAATMTTVTVVEPLPALPVEEASTDV